MWLDHLRQDLRGAVRSAARYPIAALVAAVSLAAGIGATTVALTIRNIVFHKPPPLYQRANQLSKVQVGRPDRPMMPTGSYVPGTLFATWRDVLGSSIAAATPNRGVRDVRTTDRTETAPVRAVTPNFFALLGVGPALGQLFSDAADLSRGPAPAVLSYRPGTRS